MDATNPVAQTPVSESAGTMNINRANLKMDIQTPPEKHTFPQNYTSSPVNSEGSVVVESGVTNFSSANSTMKSDSSGGFGKKGRTSHQEAIATLDNFLNDVNILTREAKLEEEKKQQLQKIEPLQISAKNKALFRIGTNSSSDLSKKWTSMPSVISDDGIGEFSSRCQKSLEDIRSIEYEVFSDEESEISAHEKKRKLHLRNQANKANQSMSSQDSDAIPSHSYGLSHLNHLCKFLEQFDQLQQQNSELNKRVSNLEFTFKAPALVSTESRTAVASDNATSSQRNSAMLAHPKDKPKKAKVGKAEKIKGRTKYLASLPFVLAAKSVDNLKYASQSDKPKMKISRQKKSPSYAADDIEIGKILHIQEQWRNSSVKSPSSKDAEKRFSDFEPEMDKAEDTPGSPKQEVKEETIIPVVLVTEEASTSNHGGKISPVQTDQTSTGIKKVFPLKSASLPPRARSEERSYKNTKKMTEWGALQRAFPVPQMESNVDLLNHLESIISLNKQHSKKTTPYHGFKRHGRPKKGRNTASNMFLPSTEIPGFASTVLAAHALANQLTLTLSSSDLELLSTPDTDSTAGPGFSGQTVTIT